MNRDCLINDAEVAVLTALDGRQSQIWTCLPAIVSSVDFSAMTIECQPSIQGMITLPNESMIPVNLPLLVDCPIVFPSAGGFTLTLPIAVGDEVLVIFSSRCIDAWWQQGGVQPPAELRMHDLSDGFAILGPKSQPNVISNISSTNAQLRNNAGDLYIEITQDGKINLKTTAGVNIHGDVVITGELTVSGDIETTTGDVNVPLGEVTAGSLSIPLTTHIHPTTTAGAPTGPPQP